MHSVIKVHFITIGLLFILLLTSCSKKFGTNAKSLFSGPEHGVVVPIDSIKNLAQLLNYLQFTYCEDTNTKKWPVLYLDITNQKFVNELDGNGVIKLGFEPTPCPTMIPEYNFKLVLEVVKDGNNISIEDERIDFDSIPNRVFDLYGNGTYNEKFVVVTGGNGIWLCASKKDELQKLAPVLSQIVKGYLLVAEEVAKVNFHKKLEELDLKQLQILRSTIPFNFAFKYTDNDQPRIQIGAL